MIGELFNSYEIEAKLGEGGMGEVYLATHRRLDRKAAIKLLLPEHSKDPQLIERFFTEARATSRINHPGIVEVLDCDVRPDGRAYIVMEFLDGESLRQRVARGTYAGDIGEGIDIAAQLASALGAAHDAGIVHRDLKPDNIYLIQGHNVPHVKVLDFGIAKLGGQTAVGTKTKTGVLLGTPTYMSPEQCHGAGRVDARADIYALGCILYEMLCGTPPFVEEGVGALLVAHMHAPPPDPRFIAPSVPEDLAEVVLTCLRKSPDDRFPSMHALLARLEQLGARVPWVWTRPRTEPSPANEGVPVRTPAS